MTNPILLRLTIKATCNMNLANFPMDDQLCTVEIESFGYTMADLRLVGERNVSSLFKFCYKSIMTKNIFMACLCADCPSSINLVLAAIALDSLRKYGNRRVLGTAGFGLSFTVMFHCWKSLSPTFNLSAWKNSNYRNFTFLPCSLVPCLDWME